MSPMATCRPQLGSISARDSDPASDGRSGRNVHIRLIALAAGHGGSVSGRSPGDLVSLSPMCYLEGPRAGRAGGVAARRGRTNSRRVRESLRPAWRSGFIARLGAGPGGNLRVFSGCTRKGITGSGWRLLKRITPQLVGEPLLAPKPEGSNPYAVLSGGR